MDLLYGLDWIGSGSETMPAYKDEFSAKQAVLNSCWKNHICHVAWVMNPLRCATMEQRLLDFSTEVDETIHDVSFFNDNEYIESVVYLQPIEIMT